MHGTAAVPDFTELQLRVARRADELAWMLAAPRTADRELWLRAEFEILEQTGRARPRA